MQEVLVDGGQFELELAVEVGDDLLVALHGISWGIGLEGPGSRPSYQLAPGKGRVKSNIANEKRSH
jgi:hypothetical protein